MCLSSYAQVERMLKKNCFYYLLLFYWPIVFSSCENTEVNDARSYIQYIENEKNGLLQKKNSGNYVFYLQYKPTLYMVLMDNENLPVDRFRFLSEEKAYGRLQYYTLRVKANDDIEGNDPFMHSLKSEKQYDSLLYYFETDMKRDIRLIVGNDTSFATSIEYGEKSGSDECKSFVISFPASPDVHTNRTFVFHDRLLKTGMIRFTIKSASLSNIPVLKL
jgi:hypothetical protein